MMADWIEEQIAAFGRLLGLTSFALNARGMAAVAFENGVKLRLEVVRPDLWVQVLFPLSQGDEAMTRLLQEAHPGRNVRSRGDGIPCVRAAYLERSGEALLAVRLGQDEIEASRIDTVFRELFERAVRLGRAS